MVRLRLEHLFIPIAGCILVLQIGACRDLGKTADHTTQSTQPPHSTHSTKPPDSTQAVKPHETHGEASSGACSKADRAEYIHDRNPKFITQLRDCSKETWADKSKNISCLHKIMPSLSNACAGCFADMASCSLANCKLACAFSSTSDGCNHCANSNCQPSLVKCTGVARADLP